MDFLKKLQYLHQIVLYTPLESPSKVIWKTLKELFYKKIFFDTISNREYSSFMVNHENGLYFITRVHIRYPI